MEPSLTRNISHASGGSQSSATFRRSSTLSITTLVWWGRGRKTVMAGE
ncbi:hypothetical protein Hamer_G014121 [Homarus americanus]|uniref:Uncharacterized protein n=1 Tax=Homarus americanus TaxID=6706 RepID=A0A8J5JSD8_HOMAM|nr:hypothetical protein Hamer_G014121 [Homarus americanus]